MYQRFKPLWEKMLACQSKPSETRQTLRHLKLNMAGANAFIQSVEGMNWTSLLVCVCELRQAMGPTAATQRKFHRLMQHVSAAVGVWLVGPMLGQLWLHIQWHLLLGRANQN